MKYRSGKNKVKQEHGMIKDLKEFLHVLAKNDHIQSIIPGPIKPVKKAVAKIVIKSIIPTHSGYKTLIQAGAAVQEVFFVGEQKHLIELLTPHLKKNKK